jgi:diguanylate cyclase (GGDEF)-like protein
MEARWGIDIPFSHNRLVLLLDSTGQLTAEIISQLSFFGYETQSFTRTETLVQAVHIRRPAAVLMTILDIEEAETRFAEIALLKASVIDAGATPSKDKGELPVLVISDQGDLATRLQAVRSGASGFFVLPLDITGLVELLDRYSSSTMPQPYHVLVVEDSMTQASLFAMQLKRAGMETRIVSDPTQIVTHLQDFSPDLILMDMYMPGCTGLELAQVIRQMENFVSVPIVYLSAETDKDRQLEALEQGGDDFLTKPIKPGHLVSAVTSRIIRYRRLRSLMMFDGLTGLLNHTTTKENLSRELLRARREGSPLSLAMIDLDRFKLVNDRFGHAMGDRVLKGLARLLRQRLRRTDIIGRAGGEEFAVILPNTPAESAVKLLDALRESFAQILHHSEEIGFRTTFSCGIASSPPFIDLAALSNAADKALYMAKHKGRNQIHFSTGITAPFPPDAQA